MAALHEQQNTFYIPSSVEQEMSKYMFASLPQEACGVVLGEAAAGGIRISRFQPIRNVAPDPLHHFALEDAEWIRCVFNEPQLIGLFHSHPRTTPIPSNEDLRNLPLFAGLLQVYFIGAPDLTADTPSKMLLNGYRIHSNVDSSIGMSPGQSYSLQPARLSVT
ncbi:MULTISPECIES: Mov34/MPN/PAD-1 family protein [Paenibacillus]|uniref:Proteasome lid subunit RPN8/RPN11 n=1 Tax=Paenibacillus pabuli TaxID=1472 RepID=A0A855XKI3_9BACL|nr:MULTISPECIES: Mov34/MPN/PAD-1 family protein [Paenibacillus]PWW33139.1 proteasome lid subunit RPN8/RPN11 [Paenibacillus pabuli]PXV99261.1 proteasome lid subunit RPN8/RPN11 [Paenibacillus taichungensis]RAJ01281.1 proteasome lid subunit RPN8/RPN11 [Paenibacillus pabuli]